MTQLPLTLDGVADDLDTVKDIMFTLARQYERIDRTVDQVATQQKVNTEAIANLTRFMMQFSNSHYEKSYAKKCIEANVFER